MFGTDRMTTRDVLRTFAEYGPRLVEWLTDSACMSVCLCVCCVMLIVLVVNLFLCLWMDADVMVEVYCPFVFFLCGLVLFLSLLNACFVAHLYQIGNIVFEDSFSARRALEALSVVQNEGDDRTFCSYVYVLFNTCAL